MPSQCESLHLEVAQGIRTRVTISYLLSDMHSTTELLTIEFICEFFLDRPCYMIMFF